LALGAPGAEAYASGSPEKVAFRAFSSASLVPAWKRRNLCGPFSARGVPQRVVSR
jgi:hypothetical protein